jgi:hypothetical protein
MPPSRPAQAESDSDIRGIGGVGCLLDQVPEDLPREIKISSMKGALTGQQFTRPVNLLDGMQVSLDKIQSSELKQIFQHWAARVHWVLGNNSGRFHE